MKSLVLRKWVCRLLILILTLSGMCLEEAGAFSFIGGMEQEACAQRISQGVRMLVDWEVCTDEQMGNEAPEACIERAVRGRKIAESRDILDLVKEYPCCALALFEMRCAEHMQENSGRSVAVCYAQRQDGKKHNLSISERENKGVSKKEID